MAAPAGADGSSSPPRASYASTRAPAATPSAARRTRSRRRSSVLMAPLTPPRPKHAAANVGFAVLPPLATLATPAAPPRPQPSLCIKVAHAAAKRLQPRTGGQRRHLPRGLQLALDSLSSRPVPSAGAKRVTAQMLEDALAMCEVRR